MSALLTRTIGTSGANAAQTVSAGGDRQRELLFVTCVYSGAPTQAGVTVTLNSGAGAGYDTVLNTGAANAQVTTYHPSHTVIIANDDVIDVTAPAGGGALTSSIAIYTRPL